MSCTDYTVIDRYLLTIKLEKNIEKPDFSSISAELELPPMHMHVMNYYTSLTFGISKQALQEHDWNKCLSNYAMKTLVVKYLWSYRIIPHIQKLITMDLPEQHMCL
jgi:hypothetical protein